MDLTRFHARTLVSDPSQLLPYYPIVLPPSLLPRPPLASPLVPRSAAAAAVAALVGFLLYARNHLPAPLQKMRASVEQLRRREITARALLAVLTSHAPGAGSAGEACGDESDSVLGPLPPPPCSAKTGAVASLSYSAKPAAGGNASEDEFDDDDDDEEGDLFGLASPFSDDDNEDDTSPSTGSSHEDKPPPDSSSHPSSLRAALLSHYGSVPRARKALLTAAAGASRRRGRAEAAVAAAERVVLEAAAAVIAGGGSMGGGSSSSASSGGHWDVGAVGVAFAVGSGGAPPAAPAAHSHLSLAHSHSSSSGGVSGCLGHVRELVWIVLPPMPPAPTVTQPTVTTDSVATAVAAAAAEAVAAAGLPLPQPIQTDQQQGQGPLARHCVRTLAIGFPEILASSSSSSAAAAAAAATAGGSGRGRGSKGGPVGPGGLPLITPDPASLAEAESAAASPAAVAATAAAGRKAFSRRGARAGVVVAFTWRPTFDTPFGSAPPPPAGPDPAAAAWFGWFPVPPSALPLTVRAKTPLWIGLATPDGTPLHPKVLRSGKYPTGDSDNDASDPMLPTPAPEAQQGARKGRSLAEAQWAGPIPVPLAVLREAAAAATSVGEPARVVEAVARITAVARRARERWVGGKLQPQPQQGGSTFPPSTSAVRMSDDSESDTKYPLEGGSHSDSELEDLPLLAPQPVVTEESHVQLGSINQERVATPPPRANLPSGSGSLVGDGPQGVAHTPSKQPEKRSRPARDHHSQFAHSHGTTRVMMWAMPTWAPKPPSLE